MANNNSKTSKYTKQAKQTARVKEARQATDSDLAAKAAQDKAKRAAQNATSKQAKEAAAQERLSRNKKIVITIVCVILALSMTIPSVATILNRQGSATATADSASTTETTTDTTSSTTTMLSISDGYTATFADLAKGQSSSSTSASSYDQLYTDNYSAWAKKLYTYASGNTLSSTDDINAAFAELITSIKSNQSKSSSPDSYESSLAFADYAYAYSLIKYASDGGTTDVSSSLSTCLTEGIAAYQSVLAASYSSSNAADLATMQYWSGDTDSAIETLKTALAADSSNAASWYNLGNFYASKEDYTDAADAYQKAIDADSDGSVGVKDSAQSKLTEVQAKL